MSKQDKVVLPGSTIGILGGGQLGRMITLAGKAMGYRFVTLDPVNDCPCAQVADEYIQSEYLDEQGATILSQKSSIITYEFENVNASIVEYIEEISDVPQGSKLLKITQNRITEKTTIASMGIPTAPFQVVDSEVALTKSIETLGLPVVMKTATGGYDGKGQWVIRSNQDLIEAAKAFQHPFYQGIEFIIEQFVPFEKELSVIVARNRKGEVETFPVAENIHCNNILHMSIVPARVQAASLKAAQAIAIKIANHLELVGLLAVEMFYNQDGSIYINELAPRPHNSGHYTMDACITTQFEQHIRAICNLPLGRTDLLSPVVMMNLLGQHMEDFYTLIPSLPKEIKFHLYGKKEAIVNRKMGHINILSETINQALDIADQLSVFREKQTC
ncbi:5-(carboxyamino)imidazole ribonucleotide synthase [Desulfuribacillus stibiiarsenatis]|uniref:N5-carboxyaminoimidazole ribonucleotide synthase n=1 Tax=Desulfuribacillus stibiiarsenatis TaxID=1390249 RepID=A0A1E5L511_9FIRM|nr:5-(carboxyamino)imidazole ribonucleotide synthase [Desulfuribacillus stibiiarsenatis]OEH85201.1 5-(carboxyamino)imidazole ribonucleotide synthase [Desulfuribacillus stibiiarsenatis]